MNINYTLTPKAQQIKNFPGLLRAHVTDAGADLYAVIDEPISLQPGDNHLFTTGVSLEIPAGYFGLIANRSSLGGKGLSVMGGIIDADYRGEIGVILQNVGNKLRVINPLDRIAQLIILPIPTVEFSLVDQLTTTDRGENGFGSTGN